MTRVWSVIQSTIIVYSAPLLTCLSTSRLQLLTQFHSICPCVCSTVQLVLCNLAHHVPPARKIAFLVYPQPSALTVLLEHIFIKAHASLYAHQAHILPILAVKLAPYLTAVSVYRLMALRLALAALIHLGHILSMETACLFAHQEHTVIRFLKTVSAAAQTASHAPTPKPA